MWERLYWLVRGVSRANCSDFRTTEQFEVVGEGLDRCGGGRRLDGRHGHVRHGTGRCGRGSFAACAARVFTESGIREGVVRRTEGCVPKADQVNTLTSRKERGSELTPYRTESNTAR